MHVAGYIERWFATYAGTWSPTTIVQRRSACTAWIVPMIGNVPLAELGPARVAEWRADLASRTTPGNANGVVAVLSAALTKAVREGLIPFNPCRDLGRLRTPPRTKARTPWQEARRILPYLERPADRLRAALMVYAGLRPSEASALRWGDVRDGYMVIETSIQASAVETTKTRTTRTCPIFPELAVELEASGLRGSSMWVAPSPQGKAANTHNYYTRVFSPAAVRSGVAVTQYDLRHACATWMLVDLGIPPVLVAGYLGHSVDVLLGIYSDAVPTIPAARKR
jgi:integrase